MNNINDYRLSQSDNDRMICKLQDNLGQKIVFNNTEKFECVFWKHIDTSLKSLV